MVSFTDSIDWPGGGVVDQEVPREHGESYFGVTQHDSDDCGCGKGYAGDPMEQCHVSDVVEALVLLEDAVEAKDEIIMVPAAATVVDSAFAKSNDNGSSSSIRDHDIFNARTFLMMCWWHWQGSHWHFRFFYDFGGGGDSVNDPSANNVMEVEDDNEVMLEEVKRVFFLKSQH